MSRWQFQSLGGLAFKGEDMSTFDFSMIARKQGLGCDFMRLSPAKWLKVPGLKESILAEAEAYRDGDYLRKRLGKTVDEPEYKRLLAIGFSDEDKDEDDEEGGD